MCWVSYLIFHPVVFIEMNGHWLIPQCNNLCTNISYHVDHSWILLVVRCEESLHFVHCTNSSCVSVFLFLSCFGGIYYPCDVVLIYADCVNLFCRGEHRTLWSGPPGGAVGLMHMYLPKKKDVKAPVGATFLNIMKSPMIKDVKKCCFYSDGNGNLGSNQREDRNCLNVPSNVKWIIFCMHLFLVFLCSLLRAFVVHWSWKAQRVCADGEKCFLKSC